MCDDKDCGEEAVGQLGMDILSIIDNMNIYNMTFHSRKVLEYQIKQIREICKAIGLRKKE